MHHLKTIVFHILSALLFPFTVMYLMMCFPPHIIEVFQKLRQTHYPHKCRKILGCNLVKRNLHPVAELVDYPFLIAAQFHGTVKLFFDLRKSRLRIGGGTVSNMILPYILDNTIQIIINRVLKSHSSVPASVLTYGHRDHFLPAHDCGLLPGGLQNQINLGDSRKFIRDILEKLLIEIKMKAGRKEAAFHREKAKAKLPVP